MLPSCCCFLGCAHGLSYLFWLASRCPCCGWVGSGQAIDDDKNLYHCFACGAGGNLFGFVGKIEGVGFGEAVEVLADEYDIPVVYQQRGPLVEMTCSLWLCTVL